MTTRTTNIKKGHRTIKLTQPLNRLNILPTYKHVYERRLHLQNDNMGKKKQYFVSVIAKEIEECWKKQDIPVQKWESIYNKLLRQKVNTSNELFDCLPRQPTWKTEEDKAYYLSQLQQQGGYCTFCQISIGN